MPYQQYATGTKSHKHATVDVLFFTWAQNRAHKTGYHNHWIERKYQSDPNLMPLPNFQCAFSECQHIFCMLPTPAEA